jgi:anti-anti-sigma factor
MLTLSGELDLAVVERLDEAVSRACADDLAWLEIDLDSIAFIDSSGVHSLLRAQASCARHGLELRIVPSAHPGPQRIFEMTGIQGSLPWHSQRARARSEGLREDSRALRAQSEQLGRKVSELQRREKQRKVDPTGPPS